MNLHLPVVALAVGLALASSSTGSAAIILPSGPEIPIPTTVGGISVNLQTGAYGPGDILGGDANFFLGGSGISNDADSGASTPTWQPVRTGTGNLDMVANLAVGTPVNASSTFSTGFGGSGGSGNPNPHIGATFTDGLPGYLGFSLDTESGIAYGWMRVTLTANTPGGVIHEWAYADPGSTLLVGQIPEPGAPILALLGLGGLTLRRRR